LRRQGLSTISGSLQLDTTDETHPGRVEFAAVLPGTAGQVGLGVAVARADRCGLAAASTTLASWLATARPRTVLLASPRSFCAGVERAIEVVARLVDQRSGRIYVRKQIVHNAHVVAELEARGVVFVDELDAVPDRATVVFSAHGVSPAVRAEAARREMEVIDATCPLVTKVHAEARRFVSQGDTIVLIGHAGHEEVEGTFGEAPERMVLVETAADVESLVVEDPERVSYLTQTTLAVDETTEVVEALHGRFPALRGPGSDDICYATTNRQDALKAIAEESDLVLVVGSENSSNSQRLVELARRCGTPAHLIDDAGDIRPEWLAGAGVVGLTAGASAPPHLVEGVIAALGGLGPVTVTERQTTRETVHFALPSAVRP
jgi:4-hydroxy-3-methylbut-2-enyl diphosphate reductase